MVKNRPTVLFYCQHSLGMGHLVRSLALAESLSAEFRVSLLNGGKLPRKMKVPVKVNILNLPPLGFDENNMLVSRDGRRTVGQAQAVREKIIMDTFRTERPEVVLIELFPFGRKKFSTELLPLLEAAKGRSKIVCSVRDILVGNRADQTRHDKRAVETANRFFDAILVHSDPNFARFGESLQTSVPLRVPVFYTGFVAPYSERSKAPKKKDGIKRIIVSAGGGMVGKELFQAAIEAHGILSKRARIQTKIAGGLFLPEADWQDLKKQAGRDKTLKLKRFVRSLRDEMGRSDVSVSQCGYNTALDIVMSGVAAVVVPFGDRNGEDEQTKRANLLEKMGFVASCETPIAETLALKIEKAFEFRPQPLSIDINGGTASTRIVKGLLQRRKYKVSWLEPVVSALYARNDPVKVFFRDDDAGIGDSRLFKLMHLFETFEMPLGIAVIPKEVTKTLAREMKERIAQRRDLFAIHQHGYTHFNHEPLNRKSEFGSVRNKRQQLQDITDGQTVLSSFFDEMPQPIFTPPWNRCTKESCEALSELGFKVLSRESRAEPMPDSGLSEIPVAVDWFAKRKGVRLTRKEVAQTLANAFLSQDQVGIMLHHELMDEEERMYLRDLFNIFIRSGRIERHSIWNLYLN